MDQAAWDVEHVPRVQGDAPGDLAQRVRHQAASQCDTERFAQAAGNCCCWILQRIGLARPEDVLVDINVFHGDVVGNLDAVDYDVIDVKTGRAAGRPR